MWPKMIYMIGYPCICISCHSDLCLHALAVLAFFPARDSLHIEFPLPRMLFPALPGSVFLILSLNLKVTSSLIIPSDRGLFTILYCCTQSFSLIALNLLWNFLIYLLITNITFLSPSLKYKLRESRDCMCLTHQCILRTQHSAWRRPDTR